jgi:Arc/MetJ-type ribon-helix-helix transcriptional regulator
VNKSGNTEKEERRRLPCWSVPVTEGLDNLVEEAVAHDTHVSKSDLIRDAVREKLQRMGVGSAPKKVLTD